MFRIPFLYLLKSWGLLLIACGIAVLPIQCWAQFKPKAADPQVKTLLKQMTLDEKVSQLMNASPAVNRLGIPEYNWWNECLHGVARSGKATVFPQPIGLAATFNPSLIQEIGDIASTEARIQHHKAVQEGYRGIYYGLTMWAPNINLFRDPRWGRGHETYGEDPFLMGEMAVAYIKGLQGPDPLDLKVIATPKHFAVHSGPEDQRHGFNAIVSQQDLHQSYLPHFKKAIIGGRPLSVMCAYNRINGVPACADGSLLNKILRKDWGFNGYIVSDCGAVEDIYQSHNKKLSEEGAATSSLRGGLDLECMVGVKPAFNTLAEAVRTGRLSEAYIDTALERLLEARHRLKLLSTNQKSRWSALPNTLTDSPKHRKVALQAALESGVLLKNENNILPLKPSQRVALIGPHANSKEAFWGNYHGVPSYTTSLAEGLKKYFGNNLQVQTGSLLIAGFPEMEIVPTQNLSFEGKQGAMKVSYFNDTSAKGNPAFQRIQEDVNFSFSADLPPKQQVSAPHFTAVWEGEVTAPETGNYQIGALTESAFRLYINEKLHCSEWPRKNSGLPVMATIKLTAGEKITIQWEYQRYEYSYAKLVWRKPAPDPQSYLKEAILAATRANVVVLALGLSPNLEGEEMGLHLPGFQAGDRTSLQLPEAQKELIRAIAKINKPIVAVLINGGPVSDPLLDSVSAAVLEMWYPGQEGGEAAAQLLLGYANPSGRMPISAYRDLKDLPAFANYAMAGRTYRFSKAKPMYPFGYGLSYTKFRYGELKTSNRDAKGNFRTDSLIVEFSLKNTGLRAGTEVVQVYGQWPGSLKEGNPPLAQLVGFKKVTLSPGEEKMVQIGIAKADLMLYNTKGEPFYPTNAALTLYVGGCNPLGPVPPSTEVKKISVR